MTDTRFYKRKENCKVWAHEASRQSKRPYQSWAVIKSKTKNIKMLRDRGKEKDSAVGEKKNLHIPRR